MILGTICSPLISAKDTSSTNHCSDEDTERFSVIPVLYH